MTHQGRGLMAKQQLNQVFSITREILCVAKRKSSREKKRERKGWGDRVISEIQPITLKTPWDILDLKVLQSEPW